MNKKKVWDILMLVALIVSLFVVGIFLYELAFGNGYYKKMGWSLTSATAYVVFYSCHYIQQATQNKQN